MEKAQKELSLNLQTVHSTPSLDSFNGMHIRRGEANIYLYRTIPQPISLFYARLLTIFRNSTTHSRIIIASGLTLFLSKFWKYQQIFSHKMMQFRKVAPSRSWGWQCVKRQKEGSRRKFMNMLMLFFSHFLWGSYSPSTTLQSWLVRRETTCSKYPT